MFDWRPWEREARGGSADYAAYAEVRRELGKQRELTGAQMAEVEWEWLKRSFWSEPGVWLRMAPMKALSALWFRISPVRIEKVLGSGWKAQVVAWMISAVLNAPFLLLLGLACAASFRAMSCGASAKVMCWAPFLGGLAFVAFTYSEPRYMVPGMGGVFVLGSQWIARRYSQRMGGCLGLRTSGNPGTPMIERAWVRLREAMARYRAEIGAREEAVALQREWLGELRAVGCRSLGRSGNGDGEEREPRVARSPRSCQFRINASGLVIRGLGDKAAL